MVKKIKVVDVVGNTEVKNEELGSSVNDEVVNDQPNEVVEVLSQEVNDQPINEQPINDIEDVPQA